MIRLNTAQQNLTIISTISQNPSITNLNIGQSADSVQNSLVFLHKSQYIETNYTLLNFRNIDFSVHASEELQNNFATLLCNYKDLDFNTLGFIGQHIKYSYITSPFFQIFPDNFEGPAGNPCLQSFFNDLRPEGVNENLFIIDFETINFLTDQTPIQEDISFLQTFFDIISESDSEEKPLFFDWLNLPVSSEEIIALFNNVNYLDIETINFFNYHNTIFYLYQNIYTINMNNMIFPMYNQIFNINNINTQFNTLNELIALKHNIIQFNTNYLINIKNCLFTRCNGFDDVLVKHIFDFSVNFETLVEYGLILT